MAEPKQVQHRMADGSLVYEEDFPYPYGGPAAAPVAPTVTTIPGGTNGIVPLGRSPDLSAVNPAAALDRRRAPLQVPGYQNRGDWLDTEVMRRESGGRPNIGWRNTDLTPYIQAGKTIHGFPDWEGLPSGTFGKDGRELPSTAAGLYGITKTNWKHYAPLLGVNDFSPESQRKVADAIMATQGKKAWAASEPGAGAGARMGGRFGGMGPRVQGAVPGEAGPAAADPAQSRLANALAPSLSLAAAPAQPAQAAPATGGYTAAAAHPLALQPVPLPSVPNLHAGYQDALAAVLGGKRRGLGSVFG